MARYDYPLIVVGAGAGGLVVAIGAAKAGKQVLLVDKGTWGGDCTNFGCVPSKALIASAHAAKAIRGASTLGIEIPPVEIDATAALRRLREIRLAIRSHEEPVALGALGIATLTGRAAFSDPHQIEVTAEDGTQTSVTGKTIVLATGSHPLVPTIQGLSQCDYLTNESIFDLETIPRRMIVLGGGPIGCELAQAMQRLGSQVTLIQRRDALLAREDAKAQAVVLAALEEDGVDVSLSSQITAARPEGRGFLAMVQQAPTGKAREVAADAILVAAGRGVTLGGLHLERARVNHHARGIPTDKYGRTNQKHIFAIGDACGPPFFTHRAENQARSVLASLLLPGCLLKRIDHAQAMPRVTFTSPEVASAGLSEEGAEARYGASRIASYAISMEEVDRAICSGETEGFIKIVTKKWSSRILGVTIVASRAGEMLGELTLAMQRGIPLRKISSLIHPYPVFSQGIRKAADGYLTQTLASLLRKGKRG